MNRIIIETVEAINNKLIVNFRCSGKIAKFFEGDHFFVEYDISIEDTPKAILVIPFLSVICPIAWANEAEIYVETVDETFLQSLENVRLSLQKFYPQIIYGSKIHVKKIVAPYVNAPTKVMMLFSGGVDSLATYIRHQIENPVLVAVHGSEIAVNNFEGWRTAVENLRAFSKTTGTTLRTIRSNFKAILDWLMLGTYYKALKGDWWQRVMHGLALLGLCAPLAYIEKIGKLYIAATSTAEFGKPWGSAPEIDNNVKWTGTIVSHDGYELSRQEKIQMIAEYIKSEYSRLHIRSCWISIKGDNCSKCEKCSRTITGLELAGINPNDHGFSVEADTFSNIKENLMNGNWVFGDDEQYMWTDLQRHAHHAGALPHPEAEELVNWLVNSNVKTIKSKPETESVMNFIKSSFKYMPYPVYNVNKKLYYVLKYLERKTQFL